MKTLALLFTLLVNTIGLLAQSSGKISILVRAANNTALENVSASLLKQQDSSLYKTGISDKNGLVEFNYVKPGNYLVKLTAAGFNEQTSLVSIDDTHPNPETVTVALSPSTSTQLKEVTVTARRPFIQKLSDRL